MKDFFNKLIRIGIRRTDDFHLRTLKIALNALLYNSVLVQLIIIPYGYFVEGDASTLYLLLSFPFYALVLVFNYLDKTYLAVTTLFTIGSIVLSVFSIYSGEESMTHIFFALTVIGLAILYRKGIFRIYYFINLGITIACFTFVMCVFNCNLFPDFIDQDNDVQSDQRLNALILIATAVVFSLVVVISNGRQYSRLYKADKQKELLLAELNHRVKNNLAIILSLIRLKRDGLEHDGIEAFKDLEGRISTMALVHDDVYSRDGKTSVVVKQYINQLLDGICATYNFKKVKCKVETDHSVLQISQAMPFAMILNELVVNSMKHAFEGIENPEIQMSFMRKDDYYVFNYTDNGKGFDPERDIKENSLGVELIRSLAEQLDAKTEMHSDKGFQYSLAFKSDV
jgi:two-component sensor histidine kinase